MNLDECCCFSVPRCSGCERDRIRLGQGSLRSVHSGGAERGRNRTAPRLGGGLAGGRRARPQQRAPHGTQSRCARVRHRGQVSHAWISTLPHRFVVSSLIN